MISGIERIGWIAEGSRNDNLNAALAAVDKRVDIPAHLAKIFAQRRRLWIECGKE